MNEIKSVWQPLVSVIVITYNSAEFVLETLESISAQTYKNIELIISDDCSTDNTVETCNNWLNINNDRFARVEVIRPAKNTGLAANCNRGYRAATSDWIKIVAGDDLLHEKCLEVNMRFAQFNGTDVVFSKRVVFSGNFKEKKVISISKPSIFNNKYISANQQYQLSIRGIGCATNTVFYNKGIIDSIGGFDEDFPFFEDWPLRSRITKAGFKYEFMDEITFYYRIHDKSIFNSNLKSQLYRKWDIESWDPAYLKYALPSYTLIEKAFFYYRYIIKRLFYYTFLNRRNLATVILNKALMAPYELHKKYVRNKLITDIAKSCKDVESKYINSPVTA